MRLPFNTTCDLYYGPSSATPGMLRGTFPCRYVVEDAIFTVGSGVPNIPAYMTIDAVMPTGAFTIPELGLDPGLSDQVSIPSGTSPKFWVIYTDQILWKWHTPYYRAYLVRLPLPGDHGGVILNTSALTNYFYTWPPLPAGSGGVLLNSSGIRSSASSVIASGGAIVNGRGEVYYRRDFVSAGGVVLNGGALYEHIPYVVGRGGVLVSGQAAIDFVRRFVASGGVKINSAGDAIYHASGAGPGPPPLQTGIIKRFDEIGPPNHVFVECYSAFSLVAGDHVQITGATVQPNCNGLWVVHDTLLTNFTLSSGPLLLNPIADEPTTCKWTQV